MGGLIGPLAMGGAAMYGGKAAHWLGEQAGKVNWLGKTGPGASVDPGMQGLLNEYTSSNQGYPGQASALQRQAQSGAQQYLQKSDIQGFYNKYILPSLLESLSGSPKGIGAVQDLYEQNRGLAMAQAKEQAGGLGSAAGTGLYEGIGGVVNRSLAEEQALIAQMQNQAMDRQLNAASNAAGIMAGPLGVYDAASNVGGNYRSELMRLLAPTAAPQPLAYTPGVLESLLPAVGSIGSMLMGGPPGRSGSPSYGGAPNYQQSPTIPGVSTSMGWRYNPGPWYQTLRPVPSSYSPEQQPRRNYEGRGF